VKGFLDLVESENLVTAVAIYWYFFEKSEAHKVDWQNRTNLRFF